MIGDNMHLKKLAGKVAVVTGASSGIGRSIAIELAKNGATVVINYKSNDQGAAETLSLIRKNKGHGKIFKGDISHYQTAKNLVKKTIHEYGHIDILVNNAGVSKIGLFTDMTEQDWDDVMNTNLKGVFNCCHQAVKYMLSQKSGSIINISSIWGNYGGSCEVLYSASKGGINAFTKALAKELAPSGIRVNAIAPGVIDTDMNECFTAQDRQLILEDIPMQRFGQAEDVAKLATYLASDDANYITAQIITVDGGMF